MKKRSYRSFKYISDVCEEFNLKLQKTLFVGTEYLKVNEYCFDTLLEFFDKEGTFSSETSICERIIFPILHESCKKHNLPIWSQMPLNVDKSKGLTGNPDFLFAPEMEGGVKYKKPIICCLAEAKKNDFEQGWGQVSAEMVAAQIANQNSSIAVFGIVSDGQVWEFGKLKNNIITLNKEKFIAPKELQEVFNALNWLFCEARKNADQLLMIND